MSVAFIERISRYCHREADVWFRNVRVLCLLFASDVVLLDSPGHGLQSAVEGFKAECKSARKRPHPHGAEDGIRTEKFHPKDEITQSKRSCNRCCNTYATSVSAAVSLQQK
ncbi:hypothetical protein ILYODFUR_011622 [Ilyodon furcidens]|uniref:Uncharacterized protein n=1 Tax=Ilyodon furcidens TaxID=33524 RepID=A0ABV0T9I5_9TELE